MASFNKLRKLINKYEKEFSMNNYNGDLTKENSYTYINGIIPILISAPHCVNHYRGGNLKKAEILTGSLLKVLHRRTNCHIIYKNKNDGYDFNYDRNGMANEYKEKIIDIIEKERIVFFIDIHGMNEKRFLDIDIGTNHNNTINNNDKLLSAIKDFFESEGIYNVGFNQIFTASHDNNITNLISKETKIPTMQLEINKYYRNTEDMKNMLKLITALENIIYFLSK